MAIELIDIIKPKNGGSFPMVEAKDVAMPDGTRLSEFNPGSGLPEIAPTSETVLLEDQVIDGFVDGVFDITPAVIELVEGETYRVIWDGTEHECVCFIVDVHTITDATFDENWNLLTYPTFAFMYNSETAGGGNAAVAYTADGSFDPATSHTVSLYHVVKSADEGKVLQVVNGEWKAEEIKIPDTLPAVTEDDNGTIMQVVDGAWVAAPIAGSAVATYIDEYIAAALEGDY